MFEMRREMQMIFQDPYASLDPRKTVLQTISEPIKLHGICKTKEDIDRRARELMDVVGLSQSFTKR